MGNEASIQAARADELALMQALQTGDLAAMQTLLKQNPQLVYAHSKAGENLWHFAAQGGHVEVLNAVAAAVDGVLAGQKKQDKFKAQVNHGFNQVNQAVNQVISSAVPLPAAIAIPMSKDIDVNAQTRDGVTPLMAAVKAGKPEAAQQLLDAGADAWKGDHTGATALHHAAWQGEVGCLALLLRHAEREEEAAQVLGGRMQRLVNTNTNTGLTPLHYAAWRGQSEALKQLVNAGAALAAPSASDTMGAIAANAGSTALHLAAMKGEVGIVRLLLRANAKLMALAAAGGAAGLAAVTATSGARSDLRKATDRYGKTPATLAWDMQRSDLALILDPNTPLEQAIELATAAAKSGGSSSNSNRSSSSANPAAATGPGSRQQQLAGGSSSRLRGGRRPGDASVDSGPSTPVAAAAEVGSSGSSSSRLAGEATAGLQRLGLGRSGSRKGASNSNSNSSTMAAASKDIRAGGTIYLPPPKSRQESSAAVEVEDGFGAFTGAAAASTAAAAGVGASSSARAAAPVAPPAAAAGVSLSEPPQEFVCPITNDVMKDPVRACDGVAYEREAIEVWFQLGNTQFPGGRARITSEDLQADGALRQAIAAWKAAAAAGLGSGQ